MPGTPDRLLFGIHTIQTWTWPELRDCWKWFESLGFDSLWLPDHYFPTAGRDKPMFEAWTLLSGLALVTERARIGILVSSNTFRHPALLAKQAVTVDHLSEGRLELGIGAGWFVEEHEVFGLDFPETRTLVDRFAEAVQLIDQYLTHDQTSFEGEHYRLNGAWNRPAPVQQPRPPLVMGAHGPRMLKLVARYADTWNSFAPPEELVRRNQQLTDYCEAIGRDPRTVKRSMFYGVNQSVEEKPWSSTDAFEDYIGRYQAAGMQEFILQPPLPDQFGVVERVASDILPRLRDQFTPLAGGEV
ncbi:MAG TPA: TIGR03560 family F420-dependent LLM class oxidoreductase [Thermomicrobiales bacterium]|nr:TIGR03560 family F420-dependent LLM class oxidoreductase [Thermomicrobiales bacterium]